VALKAVSGYLLSAFGNWEAVQAPEVTPLQPLPLAVSTIQIEYASLTYSRVTASKSVLYMNFSKQK